MIYTPHAGATVMLVYINGKLTMGELKSSILFLTNYVHEFRCGSRYEADIAVSLISFTSNSMG
jgi:hypothetical protein